MTSETIAVDRRRRPVRPTHGARRLQGVAAWIAAVALLALSAGVAFGDQVRNDIGVTGADTISLTGPTGSTTVKYWVHAANDCDAADGTPAVLTLTVPAAVTASATQLTITACDLAGGKSVTFTSGTVGDHAIKVAVADPDGSYVNQADFLLKVRRTNTAPVVTVTGVMAGASYERGSVPAATCQVNDVEDGARTFAATLSGVSGPLAAYGLGDQTASCTATDSGGLTGSDSKTYRIVDTVAPLLTLPGDVTQEATGPGGATAAFGATATDAVDPAPVVVCTPASGSTFPLGTTPVTCTARDAAGNSASGVFNVIVQDTTKPDLTVPGDLVREATGPSGASVGYTASATDTVDGALTPACAPLAGSTFALGRTPVNCTATDSSGNKATAGFNVDVIDTTPPTLVLPAGGVTVEATGPSGARATYAPSATDLVDGAVPVSCSVPSGSTFDLGTTTVHCSATDSRGNAAHGSFVVTVRDTTAPALHLPGDLTREASKPQGADVAFPTSATDAVDGNVPVTCDPASGGTFAIGATLVACEATDVHGNKATGSFTLTVVDTTAPTMTGVPADQVVEATGAAGATATYALPTATDVVDGARAVGCAPASGSTFPLGATTVTCSAADTRANAVQRTFVVTVVDTTPPTVVVPADIVEEATSAAGAAVSWSGVSAGDLVDGPLTASCDRQSGSTFELGATVVTCSAADAAGNTGSKAFTVTVQDTRAPVVSVPADIVKEATGPSGAAVTFSASAEDAVDGKNLRVDCVPPSGSTFPLGTRTVTCSSTDRARNVGEGAFTVTVEDTTPPSLTVPGPLTREATSAAGAAVTFTTTATDVVDADVAVDCGDTPSGHTFPLGSPTTVTCTATDDAGNTTVKSFTVTVVDTTAPALTVPANALLEAGAGGFVVHTYSASATDLVDGVVAPQCNPSSGSAFALGTTTVTCTAVDARGNQVAKSFTVKVQDTTAPTVTLPGNLSATATSAAGAVVNYTATASDVVDGPVNPTCVQASGTTFKPGSTTVTCTAKDAAGNTSSPATFTVAVSFAMGEFLPPVDGNKVLNGMKAGSTAPIKWQVPNGSGGFISDLSIVNRVASGVAPCSSTAPLDDLELYATGNTALRYDATANQFVYNWQSPKSAGKCYVVTVTLTDGTAKSAMFQLK